jgi:GT2 family glycosyltransferase
MLSQPNPAEVLSAACLMIRREVIKTVGLLAEDYFLFSEENDYFLRMQRAGLTGWYLPTTEVIHLLGVSRKKRGAIDSEINFFRSRQLYYKKHFYGQYLFFKLVYLPFLSWSLGVALVRRAILGRRASDGHRLYSRLLKVWWSGA